MTVKLTKNAERALLFEYVVEKGRANNWSVGEQIRIFCRISDLSEADAIAAYAELQDAGMVDRT